MVMYSHNSFRLPLQTKCSNCTGVKNTLSNRSCLEILVEFWQKDCSAITGTATHPKDHIETGYSASIRHGSKRFSTCRHQRLEPDCAFLQEAREQVLNGGSLLLQIHGTFTLASYTELQELPLSPCYLEMYHSPFYLRDWNLVLLI